MEVFTIETKSNRRHSGCFFEKIVFRCFTVLALVLLVTFVFIILVNITNHHLQEEKEEPEALHVSIREYSADEQCEEDICVTKNCVISASRIQTLMDTTVNPCDDFYSYACGRYVKEYAPRYYEEVFTPTQEAADNVLLRTRKIFSNINPNTSDDALKKTKFIYDSCMNEDKRANTTDEPLRELLSISNIQWPFVNDEFEVPDLWIHFVAKMEKYLINTLFEPTFKTIDSNPAGKIAINCTFPLLPSAYYLHSNESDYYYDVLMYKDVLVYVLNYFDIETSVSKRIADDIIRLETHLAQALQVKDPVSSCDETCDRPRCSSCENPSEPVESSLSPEHKEQLQTIWQEYLGFIPEVESSCKGNLNEAMKILNSSPLKTVMNYIGWRTIVQLMQHTVGDLRHFHISYLIGIIEDGAASYDIWQECANLVKNYMGYSVANAFWTHDYFTSEDRQEIESMFHDLRRSFGFLFQIVPWMDDNTRLLFTEKLMKIRLNVGYLDVIQDRRRVDALYSTLTFDEDAPFFENFLKLRAFLGDQKYARLQQVSKSHQQVALPLEYSPLGTTSRYDYQMNKIDMGLGLFTPPIKTFGIDDPRFLKYAQAVHMARELSFAFDTRGNLYDGDGNYQGMEWWPNLVKQKFKDFLFCLIEHNLKYNVDEDSRESAINNDIADLGAFFITYAGLSIHLKNNNEEKPLPGSLSDKNQTYFLQAAQLFCELRHNGYTHLGRMPLKSVKERVNFAVSNMMDFGSIFNCPTGTPMNPEKKCNLLS